MSPYERRAQNFLNYFGVLIPAFQVEGLRHENCLLMGYYAASSGNSFTDVSGQSIGPIFKGS